MTLLPFYLCSDLQRATVSLMKLMTPSEYAKHIGVDRATVYRWIKNGNVPVVWQKKEVPRLTEDAKPLDRQA